MAVGFQSPVGKVSACVAGSQGMDTSLARD